MKLTATIVGFVVHSQFAPKLKHPDSGEKENARTKIATKWTANEERRVEAEEESKVE